MLLEEPVVETATTQELGTAELPGFLIEARAAARERFEASAVPRGKDERWRFANLAPYRFTEAPDWAPLPDVAAAVVAERSRGLAEVGGKAVFANGRGVITPDLPEELKAKGVIWLPLDEAAARHPELLQRYFQVQGAPLGSERFADLHMAMGPVGTFLYVPKNVEITLPLEAWHWQVGAEGAVYPHTLIVAERHSKVTFLDYQRSLDPAAKGYAAAVTDLHVGEGAQVTYVAFQQWGSGVVAHQINSTEVGRDGAAKSLTVNLGAQAVRSEHFSRLTAAGGRSDMLCITTAEGSQTFDLRTLQEHQAPNTQSDLLYKNTLNGSSKTVFSGLIKVDPGAHGTDAYQTVRNLLLDENAEADSMPGLEILADEVKCSHGATTGQVDAEELFYMQARGIPADQAKRLVVGGFLQEVAQRLDHEEIEAKIADLVAEHFYGLR
jgi:Fe-S cluster assembly protein SufD